MKSREETFLCYLIGDGFFDKLPKEDSEYFRLAGVCAGSSWKVKRGYGQISTPGELKKTKSAIGIIGRQNSSTPVNNEARESDDDSRKKLYCAKKNLPYPIYQETYSKWKWALDLNQGVRRVRRKTRIYIQPLDEFPTFFDDFKFTFHGKTLGFFQALEEFARRFFLSFTVSLLDPVNTSKWKVKRRLHKVTGESQQLAVDLNRNLSRLLPRDGVSMIGVTWTDLYPSEQLNFVLGETTALLHTATMSFGRFETKLYEKNGRPDEISCVDGNLIWKAMKVLAHETCHTFFISHCVFYECLMNESSSVAEAMNQPLFLCPVCVRKLQKVCKFRVKPWHEGLLHFLSELVVKYPCEPLTSAVDWLTECVNSIPGDECQ